MSEVATSGGESAAPEGVSPETGISEGKVPAPAEDEFEEVKIGSEQAKLPKKIAAAIKNYERGVQAKFQEMSRKEKMAAQKDEQFWRQIKENPKALKNVLSEKGINPVEFSEMTLLEQMEAMGMSPEQKRLKELEEENGKFKQEREKQVKEAEELKNAELHQKLSAELEHDLLEAWKESQLPKDTYFIKQMSAMMRDSSQLARRGDLPRPLTAKEAASIVKERFEGFLPQLFGKIEDPSGILKLIGEANFTRLRDWDVKRVSGTQPPTLNSGSRRPGDSPASTKSKDTGPAQLNELEWRERFGAS